MSGDIAAALSEVHPRRYGTKMHVSAWKAPSAITMIACNGGKAGIRTLVGTRDDDGNTPLQLCAGNLDHRLEAAAGRVLMSFIRS